MTYSTLRHFKFVTGNPNKVREAREILGIEIDQVDLPDLYEIQTHVPEEIVKNKAEQAFRILNSPVIVEDSALVFTAWNGLPGALVKWFEVTVGCEGLLRMLEGFDGRQATAVCCVGVHDGKDIRLARGEVHGKIAERVRGGNGFGWDVIFIPEGHDRTFAEMTPEEKNTISHRRKAFETLKRIL